MNPTSNISQADSQLRQRLSQVEKLLRTDPPAADAAAAEILRDYPDEPMAGLFRGIALRLMGDTTAAIEMLRSVCECWPEAPLPQLQLGIALREADDLTGAIDAVRCAVVARPDFPDAPTPRDSVVSSHSPQLLTPSNIRMPLYFGLLYWD